MELQKGDPRKTMGMLLGGWGLERGEREDAINCVKRSIVCDNQNWNLSYHDGTLKVCMYICTENRLLKTQFSRLEM